MAGEDLDLGDDGGASDANGAAGAGKKKHKPLSKGQKIGVGIGLVTILLVIIQIERSKSASSSTSAASAVPIDPDTGYPEGSAQDQSALSSLAQGTGSLGGYDGSSYSSGAGSDVDPGTGATYSSEISNLGGSLSTLGSDYTTLENQFSAFQGEVLPPSGTGTSTPPQTITNNYYTTGSSTTPSSNLANLQAELAKDTTGANKGTKGAKANIPVLQKQIAALKAKG